MLRRLCFFFMSWKVCLPFFNFLKNCHLSFTWCNMVRREKFLKWISNRGDRSYARREMKKIMWERIFYILFLRRILLRERKRMIQISEVLFTFYVVLYIGISSNQERASMVSVYFSCQSLEMCDKGALSPLSLLQIVFIGSKPCRIYLILFLTSPSLSKSSSFSIRFHFLLSKRFTDRFNDVGRYFLNQFTDGTVPLFLVNEWFFSKIIGHKFLFRSFETLYSLSTCSND